MHSWRIYQGLLHRVEQFRNHPYAAFDRLLLFHLCQKEVTTIGSWTPVIPRISRPCHSEEPTGDEESWIKIPRFARDDKEARDDIIQSIWHQRKDLVIQYD